MIFAWLKSASAACHIIETPEYQNITFVQRLMKIETQTLPPF